MRRSLQPDWLASLDLARRAAGCRRYPASSALTSCWPPAAASPPSSSPTAPSAGPTGMSTRGTTSSARWRSASAACTSRPGAPMPGWRRRQQPGRLLAGPRRRRRRHTSTRPRPITPHTAAVGVWHELLVTGDEDFAAQMWPVVRGAIEFAIGLQTARGEIIWRRQADGAPDSYALLTGNASMYQSLGCAIALADLVGEPQPDWELAAAQLGHAVASHPDVFADKSRFSMDWYYPVLGGPVRGPAAEQLLKQGWDTYRGARPRRALRQRRAVGDRRGDVRAGDRAGGDRRPRQGPGAVRADPVPARPGGRVLDRLAVREPQALSARAEQYTAAAIVLAADVLVGAAPARPGSSAPRRRRPAVWPPADPAACGCPRSPATAPSSQTPARIPRIPSPVRCSTCSDPATLDLFERARPAPAGTPGTAPGRRPPGRRRRRGNASAPPVRHPWRPALVVGHHVLLAVAAVDEQHPERRAPDPGDVPGPADHCDHVLLQPGARQRGAEERQRVHPAGGRSRPPRDRGAPSPAGSPPSRGDGPR